jgi:hypothetical protein
MGCTCAAVGHMIQAWTSQTTGQAIIPDADIVGLYERACGYDPSDPDSDQGGVEIDVLNYWRRNGVDGHGLDAFAAVSRRHHADVKDAVWLFGGAYIGVALPLSAQSQQVWDVPPGGAAGGGEPGSWGGHAVPVIAYDAGGLTCITWGALKRMTWAFWDRRGLCLPEQGLGGRPGAERLRLGRTRRRSRRFQAGGVRRADGAARA